MRTNPTLKPAAPPCRKLLLAALPVVAILGVLSLINHAAGDPPKDNPPKDQADTVHAGATLFRERCARCHGKDGKGGDAKDDMPSIPDFSDATWHKSRTNAQLSASILDGKGKQMPAFRERLKAEDVKAVLAYIRTLGPTDPPAEPKQAGDFDEQFRHLVEEMQTLKKQLLELHEKHRARR